jgi:ribosome-associated translation inhibitor RaiA
MQIQVNTDNHIEGSAKLTQYIEGVVSDSLDRFSKRITRVEVQLTDENSSKKGGDDDIRCTMEARLNGMKPITVSHEGSVIDQAVSGCANKLEKTLKRTLDKIRDTGRGTKAEARGTNLEEPEI